MTHEFDSIIAIADELEISRQALNRKAKRLNIDLSKKSFTDKEWKLLALTKRKPKTSTSSNYVDTFTAQQIAEKDDLINYLKSQIKDNIIPDINIRGKIENQKDILKANIDSNIVDFNMDYQKDKKIAKIYGNKFTINYDVDKKKLTDGKGRIPFEIYHTANYLDFIAKNNKIEIKELKLADNSNKNNTFIAKGNANLDNGEFSLNYEGKATSIKRKVKENDLILSFDGKGKIENKNNILSSQGQINDLSLEYIGKIEKINGTYNFKKVGKDIEANILTKIASIGYDKYKFENFNLVANYSGNQVKIKDFSNNLISLKGNYDVKNQKNLIKKF